MYLVSFSLPTPHEAVAQRIVCPTTMAAFLRDLFFGNGAPDDPEANASDPPEERRGLMTLNDLVRMQDDPEEKKKQQQRTAPPPATSAPQPRPLAKEDMVTLKRDLSPEETGAFAVEDNLALYELSNKANLVVNAIGTGMAVGLFVAFA